MKLVALNTIGLTGVEVFQAHLAELSELLVLPGQNFTLHAQNLYRPHDYRGWAAPKVFSSLNRHLLTKAGRIWMGLTKYMDQATLDAYSRDRHEIEFVARLGERRQFFDCVEAYCESYFCVTGQAAYTTEINIAYYSINIALNFSSYDGQAPARVLNVANRIDYWLASISQTRTWNCIEACKFWLVNNLFLMQFQAGHPEYRSFYLEDLIDTPEQQMGQIREFLGVGAGRAPHAAAGHLTLQRSVIDATRNNAALLREIYRDEPLFNLADTLDQWGPSFISTPAVSRLLMRFAEFWNSTSHTNFDWVGPVAEEIVEHALSCHPPMRRRSLNASFYHEYFEVHSDSHDRIESNLHHFLGCLEREIILPYLPYYLKVAMAYLISISRNYVYHSHSYIPVRQSDIYRRLCAPAAVEKIAQFGLVGHMAEVEQAIDTAEAACAYLRGS